LGIKDRHFHAGFLATSGIGDELAASCCPLTNIDRKTRISRNTEGGPAGATNILVYKVFHDGFLELDLGGSAPQSVVLMLIVINLTVVQFRYIERRVRY